MKLRVPAERIVKAAPPLFFNLFINLNSNDLSRSTNQNKCR